MQEALTGKNKIILFVFLFGVLPVVVMSTSYCCFTGIIIFPCWRREKNSKRPTSDASLDKSDEMKNSEDVQFDIASTSAEGNVDESRILSTLDLEAIEIKTEFEDDI